MSEDRSPRGASASGAVRLISARCQSAYWDDGNLRIVHYLTRRTFTANPIVLDLIRFFFSPRTIRDAMVKFDSYTPASVGEAILELIKAELLLECDSPDSVRDRLAASLWKPWFPEGAFHFLTKDAPYVGGDWTLEQKMKLIPSTPAPSFLKKSAGAERIALQSQARKPDSFFETLYARRTQREFADAPVSIENIALLLQTTWGIQSYLESQQFGPLPLKTSPSAGARHPIEVYLMALRVRGLALGLYHYHAKDHALEKIDSKATARLARGYCADQPYVERAAALFIMTAVFARTMWKYHHPRGYRVVLLDAGHLGQTFCLTATHLGLASFCTAALKDSLIENDLGIDGVSESVLYVTGVGMPTDRQ